MKGQIRCNKMFTSVIRNVTRQSSKTVYFKGHITFFFLLGTVLNIMLGWNEACFIERAEILLVRKVLFSFPKE